jgi:hypothetical protein
MCVWNSILCTCPVPCNYECVAWSTHCAITGRDNVQGRCGNVQFGNIETLRYPCPNHQGPMDDPRRSSAAINQRRSGMWQQPVDLRAWQRGHRQYERDPWMPQDLRQVTRSQWRQYHNEILADRPSLARGPEYQRDPQPWVVIGWVGRCRSRGVGDEGEGEGG